MDDSPLNKAHREQRRAEAYCRRRQLEKAADCHGHAAKLLISALALTVNTLARQSITLQHCYHLRQQKLLSFQNQQLEKYVKAMENQRMKMGSGSGSISGGGGIGSASRESPGSIMQAGRKAQAITVEMTKNTEKFDSLLCMLIEEENSEDIEAKDEKCKKHKSEEGKAAAIIITKIGDGDDVGVKQKDVSVLQAEKENQETLIKQRESISGVKKEKDILVIVEELRTLRDHQSDVITQLMTDVSFLEKENSQLRSQVRDLQNKCEHYESEQRRLRAMADSSCSPFVFSPLSEFSPDTPGMPDLAPLEMPPLDFMEKIEKDT